MKKNEGISVLITGGTSGLGFELAKQLLEKGCNVIVTGRQLKEKTLPAGRFFFISADFSRLGEVNKVVKSIKELDIFPDIIINNAGILSPPGFTETSDGFEISFQVNFFSHLLLDELIVENMNPEDRILIVSVTSPIYRYITPDFKIPAKETYSMVKAYCESKYYLLLVGEYLKGRHPGRNIDFLGFDPGTFRSGIYRMQKKWFHSMYSVASPFMRDPGKVAGRLISLLYSEGRTSDLVYRHTLRRSYPIPRLTGQAEELFLLCKTAADKWIWKI